MKTSSEFFYALSVLSLSIFLFIGGLSLSLSEGYPSINQPIPTNTILTPTPTITSFSPPVQIPSLPTPTTIIEVVQVTETPGAETNINTGCSPPSNWEPYVFQQFDTLALLSTTHAVSMHQIQAANCLESSSLIVAGQIIYLPPIPSNP